MQHSIPLAEHSTLLGSSQLHWVESGDGELLMLIHGSLCDYRYWRWQMPAFSAAFRVVAPSLPGCWPAAVGSTAVQPDDPASMRQAALQDDRYGMQQHVEAVVELCWQLSEGRAVNLVGHSRGAQVALEAALAMPGRVNHLVLADPGFAFTGEAPAAAVHVPLANKLGTAPLDEVIGEFVDAVNGPDTWRRTVPWFKNMVRDNAWTLLPQLNDLKSSVDPASLEQLDCPVLLVGGEFSPARYGSRIARLSQALTQARHVVVPRAAHGMNLANARFFNEALLCFLGRK